MMFLTMETLSVASFFLLFCFYSVFSFPSRPLNERSTELAWQAWLLVDDQNQHKQSLSENFPRRRITPKSVFIAPTFSPESLPACAEGYQPDSMGRCIKIIKLDEDAHLDFLLEKLNAQFGNYDEMEEESQETVGTPGPLQLNIPLNGPQEEGTKGLDIAIVVAPTNGNFGLDDVKTTTVQTTTNLLGNSNVEKKIPVLNQDSPLFVEETNNNSKRNEGSTFTLDEHNESTTATFLSTTEQGLTETTSFLPSTAVFQPTTPDVTEETTITSQQALFFLQPSLSDSTHVQNGTKNVNDTPPVTLSDDNNNKLPPNNSLTTFLSNSTFVIDTAINLNNRVPSFNMYSEGTSAPDSMLADNPYPTSSTSSLVRFPSETQATTDDYVRFPEQISTIRILPQLRPHSQDKDTLKQPLYQTLFKGYIDPHGNSNFKGNEHFVFKDVTNMPTSLASDPVNGNHNTHYNQVFNHRNRDKHSNLWSIPSSWSQSSPKPIVLRFSRRSINSKQLFADQFQPNTHNSRTFIREVPVEEFSYIFGSNKNEKQEQNPR